MLKLQSDQNVEFLDYIIEVIVHRNQQLQDVLQEVNGHE